MTQNVIEEAYALIRKVRNSDNDKPLESKRIIIDSKKKN